MNAPVRPRELIKSWPTTPDGKPATLMAALARNAAESPSEIAFRERDQGIWQELSWSDMLSDVLAFAAALDALGFKPGHALTVIGDNRTRLYVGMIAATALRGFPSPVFPDVPPDELTYYTKYGEPRIALAEDQEQVDKLLELRGRIGRPVTIIYDDPRGLSGYPADVVVSFDEMFLRGRARLAAKPALANDDPYGAGWLVVLKPADWAGVKATLTPGAQLASAACSAVSPRCATPYPVDVGTAMTTPGTRPPSTLTTAASMPATAITTGCRTISGTRSIRRQIPATPTS